MLKLIHIEYSIIKTHLFTIWRPAADGCCHLLALSREKVVADLREQCFEHTNIKPCSFL